MATISMDAFREQEALKYITGRQHPSADLIIWNYTPKCQFESVWNEVTLQARGLITTSDGTIVARSFPKFFNIEEHIAQGLSLPLEPFKVTEKMDGSLGVLYFVDDKPYIATRGSFTSEQAQRANQILHTKYNNVLLYPGYSYLFEIIYKENRIVVDYGNTEDLVLLAIIDTLTDKEIDIHDGSLWASGRSPFPVVKHYDGITDLASIKQFEEPNKEGFVIRFESGLRVKAKFEEYKRLHRILTQCTAKTIWECLRANLSFDAFLDRVPDEFYAWANTIKHNLLSQYAQIEEECRVLAEQAKTLPTRKEQAAMIVKHPHSVVVFHMLDNKPYADKIWKTLKPEAERPFKEDEEG